MDSWEIVQKLDYVKLLIQEIRAETSGETKQKLEDLEMLVNNIQEMS